MHRHGIVLFLMMSILLAGSVTVSRGEKNGTHPGSLGVVVTVTALDPHHDMATLTTADGARYALPAEASWKVGDQLACDLMEPSLRPEVQLQHCRPWK
jgi:hypothetical protein